MRGDDTYEVRHTQAEAGARTSLRIFEATLGARLLSAIVHVVLHHEHARRRQRHAYPNLDALLEQRPRLVDEDLFALDDAGDKVLGRALLTCAVVPLRRFLRRRPFSMRGAKKASVSAGLGRVLFHVTTPLKLEPS